MEKREFAEKKHFDFSDLMELVALLRAPDGCPWDREQTHESIRNNFVEEAYEVCEGIDTKNDKLLCEELGDVLLQIVFHTSIASEEKRFEMSDVTDGICRKMIRRHPHIFSEKEISEKDIQKNWDEIKKQEKGERTLADTLARVSSALPALKRAEKFVEKGAEPTAIPYADPLLEKGEALFQIVRECIKEELDPEQALNAYLKHLLKNCTNCE
ncbi:MAG: MazG family protein [Ruminococcaceae bacterium]|nr:MazG family protein [Oscillospiraceae bacterium]